MNFLNRFNDLALLADLMRHESIETAQIQLRHTTNEKQRIGDKYAIMSHQLDIYGFFDIKSV